MQYTGPLRRTTGAPTQGTKHSRTDETTQVANKAAKLGSTTNGNITKSSHGADISRQSGVQATNQRNSQPHGVAPGPDYDRVQTNGESLLPPRLNHDPEHPPIFNNNSGPIPTNNLPHPPSGVQNMQFGHPQAGLHQSGSQHFGSHAQNVTHTNMPERTNPIQAPPCVNTMNPQFAAHTGPQPWPASPFPWLHDVRPLIRISESIARLNSTKVLELLASAAMYHADVLSDIEIALSQQQGAEFQSSSRLVEHLVAQCLRDYNLMRVAPAAQGAQYAQPRCSQAQDLPLQQCPPQQNSPQDPQPGSVASTHQEDEDDCSEESDEDDVSEESDEGTGVLSFEARTRRVEYILHAKYAHLRDSQQVHITYDAAYSIMQQVQKVADAVQLYSPYITKHRAIGALYNIGMIVIEADGYMGNRVKNHLACDPVFIEAFQSLYDCMTEAEREDISRHYLDDLEQLDKKRDFCFEDFDGIVKQFREARSST